MIWEFLLQSKAITSQLSVWLDTLEELFCVLLAGLNQHAMECRLHCWQAVWLVGIIVQSSLVYMFMAGRLVGIIIQFPHMYMIGMFESLCNSTQYIWPIPFCNSALSQFHTCQSAPNNSLQCMQPFLEQTTTICHILCTPMHILYLAILMQQQANPIQQGPHSVGKQ